MARMFGNRTSDRIMIYSGTTSHTTSLEHTVSNHEECDVSIPLGDDSTVRSTVIGECWVKWKARDGPVLLTLSDALVAPEASISLLSVLARVKMGLGVLFVPGRAFIFNLNDGTFVIGCAE